MPLRRIAKAVSRLAAELPVYGAALAKAPPRLRFVIFAQGRTGTWLLHDLLNQHPAIQCDKEILERRVRQPMRYVVGCSHRAHKPVYGCHLQINQLLNTQHQDAARFMHTLAGQGWRIIYVRREDIVRQSISALLAVQRGQWVTEQRGSLDGECFDLDADAVLARIARRIDHLAQEAAILRDLDHLPLVYEADLASADRHQAAMDRLCAFLDQPSILVQARYQKMLPDDLRAVIRNYDDLMARVHREYPHLVRAVDAAS